MFTGRLAGISPIDWRETYSWNGDRTATTPPMRISEELTAVYCFVPVERACKVWTNEDGELAFGAWSADHAAAVYARSVGLSHIRDLADFAGYLSDVGGSGYVDVDGVRVMSVGEV